MRFGINGKPCEAVPKRGGFGHKSGGLGDCRQHHSLRGWAELGVMALVNSDDDGPRMTSGDHGLAMSAKLEHKSQVGFEA